MSTIPTIEHCRIQQQVSAAKLITFATGGPIKFLAEPEHEQALQTLLLFLKAENLTPKILGAGSNTLIPDEGVYGWVIRLGAGFRRTEVQSTTIRAGAASSLMSLSRELSAAGLSGLEFAGGIPASLGGAVRMNAGAHGGEMSQVLQEIVSLDLAGQRYVEPAIEFQFSYRATTLPPERIITEVVLRLTAGDAHRSSQLRAAYLAERKARQPLSSPSAGSVFRNPSVENPAGKLIEAAGLKGAERGGAQVSPLHANWILNPKRQARARDITELIALCQEKVKAHSGIELHPEVKLWSN